MAIVVLGNVFVDIKGFPDGVYHPTGRNAGRIEMVHGGVGRNVAEDIANLELRPVYVSMVDDGAAGAEVLHKLRQHRVNTDYVVSAPDGMGMWLAVFDEKGDLAGSISKRPRMDALLALLRDRGDEIFRDADSIVLEIDLDAEIVKLVLRYAKAYGKKVYALVANIDIAMQRRDFLKSVDGFVCNLEEADSLFADRLDDLTPEALSEDLAARIERAEIPAMVITLGGQGAVYAERGGEHGVYPAEKVAVRDTTGAGDAFCAGVAVGLTYGKSLRESVQIGTRLASAVVTLTESSCPRFLPRELGLDIDVED